jgi:serine/threonine protein phosphatase PrpC
MKMLIGFETASTSLRGDRDINQDRCAAITEGDTALLLLADGMGGHPKGEAAAQIFIDTGRAAFNSTPKPIQDGAQFLDDLLAVAHERIVGYGNSQHPPIDPRATAVAALVVGGVVYWNHMGDSRLYLIRDHQVLVRTQDHSYVEHLRSQGLISAGDIANLRIRNLVTQCLGGHGLHLADGRGRSISLRSQDLLVLCSDGLWSQLPEQQLLSQARHQGSLSRMTRDLAMAAQREKAPTSDNVSILVLRWLGQGPTVDYKEPVSAIPAVPGQGVDQAIDYLRSAIEDFESEEPSKK